MSLSEKLAQAAAARARREASETEATRPATDEPTVEASSYALRFEDVTIDLTHEVAAVHQAGDHPSSEAGAPVEHGESTGTTTASAPPPAPATRPITIDELKRRRAARFAMRPAAPTPFDTPFDTAAPPVPTPRPASAPPTPVALDDAQRQALLERLAGLRVERYLNDDDNGSPAALTAVPSGERVTELLRRRTVPRTSVATDDAADHIADASTTADVDDATIASPVEAPVEPEPVVIETPFDDDPFAGVRPNTKNLPQPRAGRLRFRRGREREPLTGAPAAAPIPGPRCASCGGPARIDIVDRASQRRHLSCVLCGRLWEEHLEH